MKYVILILAIFIPSGIFAQGFAPTGAIWHNSQSDWINPDLITYKTIESVSDTIITGKSCKVLIEVERSYSDTAATFKHYMYSENDSVFFYKDNAFHLLYDFGADTGDTVVLDYFLTGEGMPLLMIIDSTGIININGDERKVQYISCGDGLVIEFGGPVIEGIGSSYFLFPTYDGTVNGPLRCYQDDAIGLYINYFYPNYGWNYEDCNQIITGIEESESITSFAIYPNPSSHQIFIKSDNPQTKYKILDTQGNLVKQGLTDISVGINIEELRIGFYFIQLITDNQVVIKKFIRN